ncbi:hypothetical protein QTI33_34150 [Variovorax sp. J22P271]|nr:hypothetical protein [Variovorax sp. J22P271]MDM0037215.1 hypothetical protein [Variovorax sp. J22P271]
MLPMTQLLGVVPEQSGVPWLAIVLRRCVGLAGAMLSDSPRRCHRL